MTRINLVPPSELYDQHLMAEYREILMVPASLARTLRSRKGLHLDQYPREFTLNKGHVSFFYNKGRYLDLRYALLIEELQRRGFRLDQGRVFPKAIFIENDLYGDWEPEQVDLTLIRERIVQKLALRPGWYRKTPTVDEQGTSSATS